MARRKSYGKAFRVNTKGARLTSVSLGGAGVRMNIGARGARLTVRNPITGGRTTLSGGSGGRKRKGASAPGISEIWNQRTGMERIVVPVSADDCIAMTIDLKQYTPQRLIAIGEATERRDTKRQANELFQFLKDWDIESKPGKIAPRNYKTLNELPHGLALALAIEVGNRSGILREPLDSGIVISTKAGSSRTSESESDPIQEAPRQGCLRRLWPF